MSTSASTERPSMRYLVTGAASGIGRATARLLAERGDAVFLVDRDRDRLTDVTRGLQQAGARAGGTVADLTDPFEPARVIEEALAFLNGLDCLVSNAGAARYGPLADLACEEFDSLIALNLRATWLLAKAALPALQDSGGNVVTTASICGHHPAPPQGAYSVAKAGLLMLVKQMALEWGPLGVRSNSVSPGPTQTGATQGVFNDRSDPKQAAIIELRESRIPLRKLGQAHEVAEAILFLSSPAASHITGVDILVDGGLSVVLMEAAGAAAGR
ncbi:MAG: SDR family NAD(P)-dependent oxidoreductase [Actinomycetales bacterium]